MKPFAFLLLSFFAFTSVQLGAQELQRRTLVGTVTAVTVDDLSRTLGLSQNEARYRVRVKLEGIDHIVLGFGNPRSELTPTDQAKIDMLIEALRRQYTVALRLDSVVKSEIVPTHAGILAISMRR